MKKNSILSDILLASGSIGVILLAFLFEAILGLMIPDQNQSIGAAMPVVFLTPLFELLLMCAVIALIWMMHRNPHYGRIVPAIYLIVGVLMLYSNALLAILPLPDALYALTIYAAPDTMVFHAAGAVAALGLVSLWFWNEPEAEGESIDAKAAEDTERPSAL